MTDILEEVKQLRCQHCDRLIADIKKFYDNSLVICWKCYTRLVSDFKSSSYQGVE
jgi:hypothetical protein